MSNTEDRRWQVVVGVLVTAVVMLLLQFALLGNATPSRIEMNAAVAQAKADANDKARSLEGKLDDIQKEINRTNLLLERLSTKLNVQLPSIP